MIARTMHPNSLANLQPPFEPGNQPLRYSAAVMRAITKCRKVAPEMVDTAIQMVRDLEIPPAVRVKCIELILDRAMPDKDSATAQITLGQSKALLRIEIVDPERGETQTITIRPEEAPKPVQLSFAENGHA